MSTPNPFPVPLVHRRRRHRSGPGIRSIAAVMSVALSLSACAERAAPDRPGVAAGGAPPYENAAFGYVFTHPDTLEVRQYTERYLAVGRGAGEAFESHVELVVETADRAEAGPFDAWATERAQLHCAADGPDRSLQCPSITRSQPFTSRHGVEGRVLFLRHLVTAPGDTVPLEESIRGPLFLFDLTANVAGTAGGQHVLLFVRPPVILDPERVDERLVEEVAASVRLVPPSR